MADADRFSVILTEDAATIATRVAEVLAAFRKVPLMDVARFARTCWGFASEHLERDQADALATAFAEKLIPARVIADKDVPDVPPLHRAKKIEVTAEGFKAKIPAGDTPLILWKNVAVIAA